MLANAAQRGNTSMFIVNRVELLEQTAKAFDQLDIGYGLVAAGFTPNYGAPVQISSIDTLKRRLDKVRPPKIIVWDECRSLGAKGWTEVYKYFPDALHMGLDATPIRLDGTGLDKYFTELILGPSYSELQARGALVPFDVYAPGTPDMSGVHTKQGDFDQTEVAEIMDKPALVGDVVDHYLRHARGKLGITFAVNRKHSEHLAAQYRQAGIPAEHLDGDTDKAERVAKVAAFRRRQIHVLCNVNLFSAGFDVPGVEVITDCAPTQSLAMFLQRAGRGSRPEPSIGKTRCLLLDHAGNVFRHGLPDQDREWTLQGREKGKKKKAEDSVAIRQCEVCFAVFSPAPVCPQCGHVQAVKNRELEEREGELAKITPEMIAAAKVAKKIEVARAGSLDALRAIEVERGYRQGWSDNVWAARQKGAERRFEGQAAAYRAGRW